jgi:hypothetical protein
MNVINRKLLFSLLALAFFVGVSAETASAAAVLRVSDQSWLAVTYEMQLYFQYRDQGTGPDRGDDTTDIYFRRNRLGFRGQVTDKYGFVLQIEHQGDRSIDDIRVLDDPIDRFTVLDAFLYAKFYNALQLRVGLTKDPLVREHNEGCFFPLSIDRSLFVYTPLRRRSRDFGLLLWGNVYDNKIQYKVAAMKGLNRRDAPESSLRYTARVHLTLLDPENLPIYFGTYLGKKKVFTVGAGVQYQPDAVFGNVAAGTFPKDYLAWTYDIFFEYPVKSVGTFTASAAFLDIDFDDAYKGGDPDPFAVGIDGEKNGWYTKAGYMLPDKVGPGQVQFFGRYEEWKFAQLQGILDQKIDWYAAGLNYYLNGQNLRVSFQYSMNDFEKENPENQDFNTFTTMLQFRF